MPSGEGMWLSRVRENLMHGSLGERWRRSDDPWRRIEPPEGNPGTRQPGLPVITTAPALYPTDPYRFLSVVVGDQRAFDGRVGGPVVPDRGGQGE
jgi:hypothetical protein